MRMHPPHGPRPTTSHGERALYAALSKLPFDWTVFHSLRLRTKDGVEGEGDFVIAVPERGFLVLEVKSGQIELREGHWLQNGQPMKRSPRDQAFAVAKALERECLEAQLPAPARGIAVAFPDCEFSTPPTNGDLRGIVLGRRDLSHLEHALPAVIDTALPRARPPQSRKWIELFTTLWGRTWVPTVSLEDRVGDAAQRSVSLDEKQYQLLEFAGGTARALVTGGAGTGKTLVATELCRRRAAQGQETLYLCFTEALARAVERQFAGVPNLKAIGIRQLAVDLLKATGQTIPAQDKAFWDDVSLRAACDALPKDRPAMVVVDEGQDFEPNDWMLVEQLAQQGLWVFQDARQAFWTERVLPESIGKTLGAQLSLQRSYRCPSALTTFAESYVDASVSKALPPADVFKRVVCDDEDRLERVRHEVESLIKGGAKPEQIVVISLSGVRSSTLYGMSALGSVKLVHADSPEAGRAVVAETFLRFKGLERPFVVICELAGKNVTKFETRMHIALTRATVQAIVVAERSALGMDERLRA